MLVEGQETGVQLQLSLEDPLSSLMWSPQSKQKDKPLPAPMRRKQLPWNLHYCGHSPRPTILQSPYSCTDSKSLCEALISSHPQTFSIHNSVNSILSPIFIPWISGHSAIPGNDLADRAVKEATTIATDTILPISLSRSIQVIKETICDVPPTQTGCFCIPTSKGFLWCKTDQQQKRWCPCSSTVWVPSRVLIVTSHSTWGCSGVCKEDPGQPWCLAQ